MKKLFLIFLAAFFVSAVNYKAFADDETFNKRLKICNPYETHFVDSASGQTFVKEIMGVETNRINYTQSCIYYIQKGEDSYNLCRIPILELKRENFKAASCHLTNSQGLKQVDEIIKTRVNGKFNANLRPYVNRK